MYEINTMRKSYKAIEGLINSEKKKYKIRTSLVAFAVMAIAYWKCIYTVYHPLAFGFAVIIMLSIACYVPIKTESPMLKYYQKLLLIIEAADRATSADDFCEPIMGNGRYECSILYKHLYSPMYRFFHMQKNCSVLGIEPISYDMLIFYLKNFHIIHIDIEDAGSKNIEKVKIRNFILDELFYDKLILFEQDYFNNLNGEKIDYADLMKDTFKELELEIKNNVIPIGCKTNGHDLEW
ncbi:MAG: hypothetical protein MJ245_02495 [Clostridia bacterium]|nr:hypothetical protein [Clostridia bacterium]